MSLSSVFVPFALLHIGPPPTPETIWHTWTWDPWVLLVLGAASLLYARGVRTLWRRAGVGRGIRVWQAWCYLGGIVALFVALISPLDAWGTALFSAHMVQHMVLIVVAAPLLALGRPMVPMLWALPRRWRERVGRAAKRRPVRSLWTALTSPLGVWVLHAVAVWVWHAPQLYQATLESYPIHTLQHLSFFGSALLFWWVLIYLGRRGRLGYGLGVLFVFTTAVQGSLLGAVLTFAPTAWYPIYEPSTLAWGRSVLEDQQVGGLIMWVPGGLIYVATALVLLAAWLRVAERQSQRRDTRLAVRPLAAPRPAEE
jgi:putative membrane protein